MQSLLDLLIENLTNVYNIINKFLLYYNNSRYIK